VADRFVIDCGSRSIKLHRAGAGGVTLLAMRSWDPLRDGGSVRRVGTLLSDLAQALPSRSAVHVVGTAAARRDTQVAAAIAGAAQALGWSYETLSHRAEADLILDAFGRRRDCDIVNAGGGSIQLVHSSGAVALLGFGISDLNRLHGLDLPPAGRRPQAAVEHVLGHLPAMSATFVYTGGEFSYLRALGAAIAGDGSCAASEFLRVAEIADGMDFATLERLSPFDAGWMSGAVASNAIMRACLVRSGAAHYYASDINIGDGIIARLSGRRAPAPDHDH
jgi:hypothetical protein